MAQCTQFPPLYQNEWHAGWPGPTRNDPSGNRSVFVHRGLSRPGLPPRRQWCGQLGCLVNENHCLAPHTSGGRVSPRLAPVAAAAGAFIEIVPVVVLMTTARGEAAGACAVCVLPAGHELAEIFFPVV